MTALSEAQITEALEELPGWSFEDDHLTRTFEFGSFKEALSFIVRVGMHAEEAGHHPEIFNVYVTVRIALNTHDVGGKVTQRDVDLARTINGFDWTHWWPIRSAERAWAPFTGIPYRGFVPPVHYTVTNGRGAPHAIGAAAPGSS